MQTAGWEADVELSHPPNLENDDRIVLNVGGTRFETLCSTLRSVPDTLLGVMFSDRNAHLRRTDKNGEYFFDRDPALFAVVLQFYRTGKVLVPPNMSEGMVREEFTYFQIPLNSKLNMIQRLYTWGKGNHGQLGHGDRGTQLVPTVVKSLMKFQVSHVSMGLSHSLCLTACGMVFSWGDGGNGRLGHGNEVTHLVPRCVEGLMDKQVRQIDCGEIHNVVVTECGHLYSWGLGSLGRLGHGDSRDCFAPKWIQSIAYATSVSCGGLHNIALTRTSLVYTWGSGKNGRLGHGNELNCFIPTMVQSLTDQQVNYVCCGGHHTAALTSSGTLLTWGFDDDGRLGHGQIGHISIPKKVAGIETLRVVQVACGCWHTAALTDSGCVYTWGSGKSGQTGSGNEAEDVCSVPRVVLESAENSISQIACGTAHTAVVDESGSLFTCGRAIALGYDAKTNQYAPHLVSRLHGKKVMQVACGVYGTAALVLEEEEEDIVDHQHYVEA